MRRLACVYLLAVTVAVFLALVSSAAADSCPNAAVRAEQDSTRLPECRAYELVDPSTNDIGEVNRFPNMADNGNTVVYTSVVPGNDALGGGTSSISVARRGANGWTSTSADPTSTGALWQYLGLTEVISFTPDYSKALLTSDLPLIDSDQDTNNDYYVVDVGRGTSKLMTQGLVSLPFSPLGASPSLDRVIFDVTADASELGIYASDGSTRQLLSVDEHGHPFSNPTHAGTAADRGLGVGVGNGSFRPFVERGGSHAVSDDARRVYFYGVGSFYPDIGLAGSLYLNDNGTSVPISASRRTGDVGTVYPATFISASHDGSTVYFNTLAQLTDTATPGGGIYRYDVSSHALTQLTPDAGDPNGLHLVGGMASDDQSHLYFTSSSDLAPGATAGSNNAYVWTAAGGARFIATVGSTDSISRVTPDGRFALILSSASIDGAPNDGHQAVYRYDDEIHQLTCVSCRPDGSLSQGSADIDGQGYGNPNASDYHNRALTQDGSVVFTSTDRIVARDQTSAQDVYMYRNGAVSLLTAGSGDSDSFIGDVSDDAKNVFVVTRAAFVAADRDAEEDDVYDVRMDGGFPEPPPAAAGCSGDDCQGSAESAPGLPVPLSSRLNDGLGKPSATVVKGLSVARLTAAQRALLARTGTVMLGVHVSGGGTLSVGIRGRVAGRSKLLGGGSERTVGDAPGTVRVALRLSAAARRELARRGRLRITVEARLSGLSRTVSMTVDLARAHR